MHDLSLAIPQDALALGAASLGMVLFVESVKALAANGIFSSASSRKVMHVGAGPLFLLFWPLFTKDGSLVASLVPLAMTLKFAATGLGLVRNDAEVRSMSRTGDRRELLRGPLLYGFAFVALTKLCWRSAHGVAAMMALCFGDGMAEVVGRRFCPPGSSGRLPWSPRKSWVGSAAFLASAVVSSSIYFELFRMWGWIGPERLALLAQLTVACAAGAAVESLPWVEIDNVLVPLVVAGVLARLRAN